MLFQFLFNFGNINLSAQLFLQGSNGFIIVFNPAGNNMVKMLQIGIDIKCKTMHGHPSAQMNADSTNLAQWAILRGFEPNPCVSLYSISYYPLPFNAEDNHLFQKANIFVNIGKEIVQIKNRIGHYLPGTVIGNIAASVDFEKLKSLPFQFRL